MWRTRAPIAPAGGAARRPTTRLAAAAALAVFLLVQPWLVCLPMCVLEGHEAMAMGSSPHAMHAAPCHSGDGIRQQLPPAALIGAMIPARSAPVLQPPGVRGLPPAPAATIHPQSVPSADPPPPRPA